MPDTAITPDDLVLGPVLRRIVGDTATIWVETARPATVEVRAGAAGGAARTFTAYGHHYGFVVVEGLPAGVATEYRVYLDGVPVWPRPDDRYPPPVIRTRPDADAPVRLVFGSCREATPYSNDRYPPDALDAYAMRLAAHRSGTATRPSGDPAAWPDALVLLGDQVYADETPPKIRRWLSRRRRSHRPEAPKTQVVEFHEYTRLYLDSWTDPEVRWLLSTVPSLMIFDDHEIIDDWNISDSWRRDVADQPWWRERIRSGLASYWVYQHLGNLAPDALAADPVYAAVTAAGDATGLLGEFGERADATPSSYRWSFALDLGRTRIVVLDNRCGRQLEPGKRAMLSDADWEWVVASLAGDYDHLVVGASLPWLMPPGIHHLEAASERLCESRYRPVAAVAERLRRWLDLEHWPAFNRSFEALGSLLAQTGSAPGAPATLSVISGDVHHSYVARADLGPGVTSAVHQLTCSPVHNDVPPAVRPAMRFGWSPAAARAGRTLAAAAGQAPPPVRWSKIAGPYSGNAVGELTCTGRAAHVTIEGTTSDKTLFPVADLDLSPTAAAGSESPMERHAT